MNISYISKYLESIKHSKLKPKLQHNPPHDHRIDARLRNGQT